MSTSTVEPLITILQNCASQGVNVFGGTLPELMMATTNYSTRVKAPDRTTQTSRGTHLNDKLLVAGQPARSKPFCTLMTATGHTFSREACSPAVHRRSHQIDLRRSIIFSIFRGWPPGEDNIHSYNLSKPCFSEVFRISDTNFTKNGSQLQ